MDLTTKSDENISKYARISEGIDVETRWEKGWCKRFRWTFDEKEHEDVKLKISRAIISFGLRLGDIRIRFYYLQPDGGLCQRIIHIRAPENRGKSLH